jgi:hypothetical protein
MFLPKAANLSIVVPGLDDNGEMADKGRNRMTSKPCNGRLISRVKGEVMRRSLTRNGYRRGEAPSHVQMVSQGNNQPTKSWTPTSRWDATNYCTQ